MAKTQNDRRKPQIEKKRRDRINRNLSVLRTLLFNSTADTRLQNPKLEKAEILDLAVQYIQKNTSDKTDEKASVNKTIIKITQTVPSAQTDQHIFDFTSFLGKMYYTERLNSRVNLNSLRTERESETMSPNSYSKLCLSASLSRHTQDHIYPGSSSTSACPKPIVFTEQFSHPPSPLYLPPVSPPFSSSHPIYTTALSVCSPKSLPQLHLYNARFSTSQLSLDTRQICPLQTWRPWS